MGTPVPGSRVTAANDRAATGDHRLRPEQPALAREMAPAPVGCALNMEMCLRRRSVAAALCPRLTITLTNRRLHSPTTPFFFPLPGRPSISGPSPFGPSTAVSVWRSIKTRLSGEAQPALLRREPLQQQHVKGILRPQGSGLIDSTARARLCGLPRESALLLQRRRSSLQT